MRALFLSWAISLGMAACGTCEEGGRSFADGETWICSDGCNTCSCSLGELTSTLMVCERRRGAGKLWCEDEAGMHRHGATWACPNATATCGCDDGQIVTTAAPP